MLPYGMQLASGVWQMVLVPELKPHLPPTDCVVITAVLVAPVDVQIDPIDELEDDRGDGVEVIEEMEEEEDDDDDDKEEEESIELV